MTLGTSLRSQSAFEEASAAWPGVALSALTYRRRFDELTATLGEALQLEAADLYLATACLSGDRTAHLALRELVMAQGNRLGHFGLAPSERDELVQTAMTSLVAPLEGKPRLTSYTARGPLEGWLRVMLTRLAIDRLRTSPHEVPADDDVLLGIADHHDVELEALKTRHGAVVSQAFREAIAALTPRQRNLLRQHYLDDLSLEDLGAMYRVHRATAARWLRDARDEILAGTRQRLAHLAPADIDSMVRVMHSRLDLSAAFFLTRPKL